MNTSQSFELKLVEKRIIADKVGEFKFEKPSGFAYAAGQFIRLSIPTEKGAVARSYSLTSNSQDDYLEICVKFVGGVGSGYLEKMMVGDKVVAEGPKGRFTSGTVDVPKYFIGTGVGIAPLIAMLESEEKNKIHLLFGVRDEKDIFWLDRLETIKAKNPNFSYEVTLSRPASSWKGKSGRVTEHLIVDSSGHYFLCGRVEMVKDVRAALQSGGVDPKNIHFEIF